MNYRENVEIGLEGLRRHLLRSFLSMLGIIFGVGAVIAMLSIGEGAKQQALEQIQLLGMKNIIVQDIPVIKDSEESKRTSLSRGLTLSDANMVSEINPHIDMSVPLREVSLTVRYKNDKVTANVVGTTPEFPELLSYVPVEGTFFNYLDLHESRRVCALGSGIKRELFYFRDSLGERVKIGDQWFTVIGVMEEKQVMTDQKSGLDIPNMNRDVYIPITTALKRYTRETTASEINRFIARVNSVENIDEAVAILNASMNRRHNSVQDFSITIPQALLRQSRETQRIFNIVMGAIAGISLLVGGIGIMNIMLATVLERTREIGIRRAIGASRDDILWQFLFEAVILSVSGGIIGVITGFTMTKIISVYANWRTIVSWESVFLACAVSIGIGVIFGVYPARRAASLRPIEALRYE